MKPNQKKILRILKRLAAGWYLDPAGMHGDGGLLWIDGKSGERLSVATMYVLFSDGLIDRGEHCYEISERGREVLKANQESKTI